MTKALFGRIMVFMLSQEMVVENTGSWTCTIQVHVMTGWSFDGLEILVFMRQPSTCLWIRRPRSDYLGGGGGLIC